MFTCKDGTRYETRAYKNLLIVQQTNQDGTFIKKAVRVMEDTECIYKLQKTQIKAIDGAEGLKQYLDKYTNYTDFCAAFAEKIFDWIMNKCREVKQ